MNAPLIASIGLLLSDEDIRHSVAQRLSVKACSPYTCACGKSVDARGLHGLSCKRSMARHQRHSMVNDIIWRAVKHAKVPAHKEPTDLVLQNGKRPDGATLIPWSRGKALAWDVTIPDTYTMSHIQSTCVDFGSADAGRMKTLKYQDLNATHIFYSIAIETAGSWDDQAKELIEEIGRRSAQKTDDQRSSVAIQR